MERQAMVLRKLQLNREYGVLLIGIPVFDSNHANRSCNMNSHGTG